MGHETVDDRTTRAEQAPLEQEEQDEQDEQEEQEEQEEPAGERYRGPDPEADKKGDAGAEDQGT